MVNLIRDRKGRSWSATAFTVTTTSFEAFPPQRPMRSGPGLRREVFDLRAGSGGRAGEEVAG